MIRAIVFDIGNVVCAFAPERRLRALAALTGLPPEAINDAIWRSGLDRRSEAGELAPAEVDESLLDALDRRADLAAVRKAWSTAFIVDPSVRDLVAKVDRPAFAFTNNGPMFTACLARELLPLARCFERVICSWEVRARKPDPGAFERLCRELHRAPHELLFVDDSGDNTASARSIGLNAITFTTAACLAEDLARRDLVRPR